jgi:hypothetical protein
LQFTAKKNEQLKAAPKTLVNDANLYEHLRAAVMGNLPLAWHRATADVRRNPPKNRGELEAALTEIETLHENGVEEDSKEAALNVCTDGWQGEVAQYGPSGDGSWHTGADVYAADAAWDCPAAETGAALPEEAGATSSNDDDNGAFAAYANAGPVRNQFNQQGRTAPYDARCPICNDPRHGLHNCYVVQKGKAAMAAKGPKGKGIGFQAQSFAGGHHGGKGGKSGKSTGARRW